MAQSIIQASLNGGELSPEMYARVDLAKYASGAAAIRNFMVDYRGGVFTRPGTRYVQPVRFSNLPTHIIPFVVSDLTAYVIELGEHYARFYSGGGPIVELPKAITGINTATGILTIVAHGFASGDWIYLQAIGGTIQLNDRTFTVSVLGPNQITLNSIFTGAPISMAGYGVYTAGGTAKRIYTLTTPWAAADLVDLNFAQSADVLTLTHPNYTPYDIRRLTASTFSVVAFAPGPKITAPTGLAITEVDAGDTHVLKFGYVVTAVSLDGKDESLPCPIVTCTNSWLREFDNDPRMNVLEWNAVVGASSYRIYKWGGIPWKTSGYKAPDMTVFGFIGEATDVNFTDNNIAPDFSKQPQEFKNPFAAGADHYPAVVSYFQQRKVFAASIDFPETMWFSQIGLPDNFDTSLAVADNEAVTASIASLQVNAIRGLVPNSQGLAAFTSSGVWMVTGETAQKAITPTAISALLQAAPGAGSLQPLTVNSNILYLQFMQNVVRDASFDINSFSFKTDNRSELAMHLVESHTIVDWTFAEEPFHYLAAVRDDGILLTMTYVPEHDVYAWARQSTYGLFKSIACVPEPPTNAVYAIIARPVQGRTIQFIERIVDRDWDDDVQFAWCLDCGLQSPLTYPAGTLAVARGVGTGVAASSDLFVFAPGDVGKTIRSGGGTMVVASYIDAQNITVDISRRISLIVPEGAGPQVVPAGGWSMTADFTTVSGLEHLAGETVSALADGRVYNDILVSATGTITLPQSASLVTAGFPYTCRLQTLYLNGAEIQTKFKVEPWATFRVVNTRGLTAGPDFNHLTEVQQGDGTTVPQELVTEDLRHPMLNKWTRLGQVCVEVTDPLPATISGIIPEVSLGSS